MSHHTRRGRAAARAVLPRRLAPAIGVAAVLALAPASAFGGIPTTVQATGLLEPAGAIVDPAGNTWVADGAGFCRLAAAQLDAASCTGGEPVPLPAVLPPGPGAPGAPAFLDPTPNAVGSGDEAVFVPDGAAGSSNLSVLRWNPAQGTFVWEKDIPLRNVRATAASVGP